MERREVYAIGQQDFRILREGGAVYVDKTEYIAKLVKSQSRYYFLARPRRFGKSLFLSTLRYFFEGYRKLFKGLFVDSFDWDWKGYPVLQLDLNRERYAESGKLDDVLDSLFREWEKRYDVDVRDINPSQRFGAIIKCAHEKTGLPVVILVDEYDKPLVGNLNKDEDFELYRSKLASLYSNFKSYAEHIRFVLLTGVSRFSKLSVFSDLNNLVDITFSDDYADICGITERELHENFKEGIEKLSSRESVSYEEAIRELKMNYDGYRFSVNGNDIYNPWSVLNAMDASEISDYWNDTGFPKLLAESLKKIDVDLEKTFNTYCAEEDLKGLDLQNPRPIALLYQTGYLTIKDYNRKIRRYRLGIPNNEVKRGFFNVLLPYYVKCMTTAPKEIVDEIRNNFILGNPETSMKYLQSYFSSIPYDLKIENENNFHNAFYLLVNLIGLDTNAEVHTSEGSIDLLIKTDDFIYVIEFKYDHSAASALRQINERNYALPYETDGRKVFKIGVSFSSKTRRIENWIVEEYLNLTSSTAVRLS